MEVRDFQDLEIYKISEEIVVLVYGLARYLPADERFVIVVQIKRAALSIGANIAEGWGKYHYKDRIRFLYQARGSLYEVKHFLRVARKLGFLEKCSESLLEELSEKLELEGVKINNAIGSLYKAADLKK